MAALVWPTVVRFTLNGTMPSGVTWANILDASIDTGLEDPRPLKCLSYAAHIMDTWNAQLAGNLTDAVTLVSVSWVDLDSADGSTGQTTSGNDDVGPFTGDLAQAPLSANAAVLVRKVASSARGQRSGRWYQIGYPEGNADWVTLTPAFQASLQDDFLQFLADLTEPDIPYVISAVPGVLHTQNQGTESNPDIVAVGFDQIQQMTVQSRLATQRRRLRR